jgi:ESCRT-I complex subunit TSG101
MSEAFSQSPPVYSNGSANVHSTPYLTNTSMSMPTGGNPSLSYPQGYPQTTIPGDIIRESIQAAAWNKVRGRLNETIQLRNAEIDSLKKTEQDLTDGETKIQSLITNAQQQQTQAQVLLFYLFFSFISFTIFRIILQIYGQRQMKC